jgi:acyl carrier protein
MSAFTYIKQVLVEKYGLATESIVPEATLADLGLDSLAVAELMFDIGDEFGIDIPDDRAAFRTLGGAAERVDQLIQAKGGGNRS